MLESPDVKEQIADEVGDVFILALLFCHEVDIDPLKAIEQKLQKNAKKYPVEEAEGGQLSILNSNSLVSRRL